MPPRCRSRRGWIATGLFMPSKGSVDTDDISEKQVDHSGLLGARRAEILRLLDQRAFRRCSQTGRVIPGYGPADGLELLRCPFLNPAPAPTLWARQTFSESPACCDSTSKHRLGYGPRVPLRYTGGYCRGAGLHGNAMHQSRSRFELDGSTVKSRRTGTLNRREVGVN